MKARRIAWILTALLLASAQFLSLAAFAESNSGEIDYEAALAEAYEAAYTAIETEYAPDEKELGLVLYAAEGVAADGAEVVGLVVRGSKKVSQKGSAGTGWDMAMPGATTMAIVVDKATNQVVAWSILVDGANQPEYFTVPEESIDTYMAVEILEETAFDEFTEGLVYERGYETEPSEDGPVITGTTIVYTGTTEMGEFSAQIIRNCFRTAAYFYTNYN